MWKVQWREYLEFEGVKEQIQRIKYNKKIQIQTLESSRFGQSVEEAILRILADAEFKVEHLPPQMDIGFGADLKVSYQKDGKNFSFFVDVTSSLKPEVKYIDIFGKEVDDIGEAFGYQTEYFTLYFGVKKKHSCFFFYEKPVIVLCVKGFTPCTGMALTHIHNLKSVLISLHEKILEDGYGARASQIVRPNPKLFQKEFREYLRQTRSSFSALKGGEDK